jgi:hypothetical protein
MGRTRLFPPPARLRQVPDHVARMLRPLWILLFTLALISDVSAAVYVLRDSYQVQPVFHRLGLDYDVQYRGDVLVGTFDRTGQQNPVQSRIVSIDGQPVSPDARIGELARRLQAAEGPAIAVALRDPSGSVTQLSLSPRPVVVQPSAERDRDLRVGARLFCALLACAALLLCSAILALRRPTDPVAMLFAFAFAAMAATIDPPLQMWMGLGLATIEDLVAGAWFYLLLIALAIFPDGIFVPRFYRWLLYGGVPLAIFLSLPNVNEDLQGLLGVAALLAMLVGQFRRFRRLEPGIERQQIKWAGFGFVTGLLLVFAAMVLVMFVPDDVSKQNPLVNLCVLMLFSLGMAAIPIGLLVAVTRFRLWEADTVITRSAAYAVVTLIVGVVWAATSDLVKLVVAQVVGQDSEASATAVSAMIAAGIFSPTQSLVLGWTKRRFSGPIARVRGAAERLKSWGLSETPEEVATRALAVIDEAIHPTASAIVMDGANGRQLLALRDADSADDPRLIERLLLADEESTVGTLLIGRRSDGNRYNRQELEAVQELIPNLADALRVARSRHSRESVMQQRIEEMAARLAQIEGRAAKPA